MLRPLGNELKGVLKAFSNLLRTQTKFLARNNQLRLLQSAGIEENKKKHHLLSSNSLIPLNSTKTSPKYCVTDPLTVSFIKLTVNWNSQL